MSALAIRTMNKESNVDKLFRNSLKNKEYTFNEDSWESIESILDARTGKKFWYRRIGIAPTLLLLIATTSAIWYSQTFNNDVSFQMEEESLKTIENEGFIKTQATNQNDRASNITVKDNTDIFSKKLISVSSKPKISKSINNNSFQRTEILIALMDRKPNLSSFEAPFQTQISLINTKENNPVSENKNIVISPIEKIKYSNYETQDEFLEFAEVSTDPLDAKLIVNKRHALAPALGNTFNRGFSNNAGIFGHNILNSIGLEYTYQLNEKMLIGSGLFYKSKSGNGLNHNYNEQQYGFGRTVTETEINVNSLHYIEIPLFIDFQFGHKHHVNAGASFGYLTGVRNRVGETKTETLEGTQTNFTTEWGMKEYFNSVDIGLKIGYEYEVTKNVKAGVNAQFGLLDATDNVKWQSSEKFNNQEVQFTLRYNFIRF